jgi:hypothetical protein
MIDGHSAANGLFFQEIHPSAMGAVKLNELARLNYQGIDEAALVVTPLLTDRGC